MVIIFLTASMYCCKKGCTDPEAYNYNVNRSIDNGRCKYYNTVSLDCVVINSFAELNHQGNGWDAGVSPDTDGDNTFPDLFLSFITPTGYESYSNIREDVNPFDVYYTFEIVPKLTSSQWFDSGYWIYLYDFEYDNTFELIDSVFLEPFDYYESSSSSRFKTKISINKGFNMLNMDAYFSWGI